MRKNKSVHFVGIKGVGMTPLAIIAKEAGLHVSGCDISDEFITDEPLGKAGIKPLVGFSKDHIESTDLVITTGAHGGFDNPEVQSGKDRGIEIWTQGKAVGEFMKGDIFNRRDLVGISIAGSHGKTTTTAMIATILSHAGLDPSWVIGTSSIASLNSPGHNGMGKYFVAEADEYATEPTHDKTPKFLLQHPQIAVITSIELDHPDLYPTVDDIYKAFLAFAQNVPSNGMLVVCGDDPLIRRMLPELTARVLTYGLSPTNDFILSRVKISGGKTFFRVTNKETSLGEFFINVAGEHNSLNALSSIIVCLEVGVGVEVIRKALSTFGGSKRRMEYKGILPWGATLFDDYAHHPTEIKKTLESLKAANPHKRITCIFQPHTYSRTKALLDEFARAFGDADTVILIPIYPSLREEPDVSVSSERVIALMQNIHSNAIFLPGGANVVKYLQEKKPGRDEIIITMGAGDIYKIAQKLNLKDKR